MAPRSRLRLRQCTVDSNAFCPRCAGDSVDEFTIWSNRALPIRRLAYLPGIGA